MILGYNTNGLAHHRLSDALDLCAGLGYGGVAITVDVAHLDPASDWSAQAGETKRQAQDLGLRLSIETGARFLLDAKRKHSPNLMDANPADVQRRVQFYWQCLEIAEALGAPLISLWSGAANPSEGLSSTAGLERLAAGLSPVLQRARELGVQVCFEPEPGMLVETPQQYAALLGVGGSDLRDLALTLDVGHCLVTGDETPQAAIHAYREQLAHVHLDDIRAGVHEHVMFGQGDLDLQAVLGALAEIEFDGMAAVELSRDSHRGAEAAALAFQFLNQP